MTKVLMQIGLEVIRSYRRLDYLPWYAIAEFVDNSIQSYRNNKTALERAYSDEGAGLKVVVSYNRDAGVLIIRDNAMGMSLRELQRALHIGKRPADVTGLSQYGLGLKTAACWFGNRWTVRTKRLGATYGHSVTVDVEKVASGAHVLPYDQIEAQRDEHYTEIRIEQLHVTMKGRRLGKTKDMLRSMYRVDIRDKQLTLLWDALPLPWNDDLTFLPKDDGTSERQTIDFEVNGRRVHGWADILGVGSTGRTRAGFAQIRRGRLIRGWPEAWRPEVIFGAAPGRNDLVNQRVTGEIHLDDFDVTHTKDDINWQDDEEDDVQEGIKARIQGVLQRARTFRHEEVSKTPKLQPPNAWKVAIDAVVQNTDFAARARALGPTFASLVSKPVSSDAAEIHLESLASAVKAELGLLSIELGRGRSVTLHTTASLESDDPYLVLHEIQQHLWILAANVRHPGCALPDDGEALRVHLNHVLADGLVFLAVKEGRVSNEFCSLLFLKDALLRYMSVGAGA